MITKPVSKIFNVKNLYTTPDKTLSEAIEASVDGTLIFMENGVTFNPTANNVTISSKPNIDIYYKRILDNGQMMLFKAPGARNFKKSGIFNINTKKNKAGHNNVVMVYGYKKCCDGEYGIRFEIKNDEINMQQYPNRWYESYVIPASECCSFCGGSEVVDDNEITLAFYKKIMLAVSQNATILKPSMIVLETSTHQGATLTGKKVGSILTEDEIEKAIDDNKASTSTEALWKTGLVVEVDPTSKYFYGMFNFKYVKFRSTTLKAYPIGNMVCKSEFVDNMNDNYTFGTAIESKAVTNGVFTSGDENYYHVGMGLKVGTHFTKVASINTSNHNVTLEDTSITEQTAVSIYAAFHKYGIEETSGYDLRRVEFEEMGWMNESPYRLSEVTMTEFGHHYTFNENSLYDLMTISYEQESDAAWGHFQHPLEMALAVVSTDTNSIAVNLAKFFEVAVNNVFADNNVNFR